MMTKQSLGAGQASTRTPTVAPTFDPVPTSSIAQSPSSTTLPPSEPEVVLEAPPTVRAAEEHAGQRGHDPSAHGGQARRGRRSGLGRPGSFPPRAAGAAGRRGRAGTGARGGAARARTAPRSGPARARP